jgi:hypothetical protein
MYDDIPEGFSLTPGFSGYPAEDTPVFPTYRDYPSATETGPIPYGKPIELLGRAERTPRVILGKTVSDVPGLVEPGTIDLTDAFKPTKDAFHIEDGGMHVVLPKWGSREAMIAQYQETGANFGVFKDEKSADEYTQHLAKYQDLSAPQPYGLEGAGENRFGMPTRGKTGRKDAAEVNAELERQQTPMGRQKLPEIESQESLRANDRQVGLVTPGNIDLDNLTPVPTAGGDMDTLVPIAITDPKKKQTVLIPTIIDGKEFPVNDAIRDYRKTGKHLGVFKDPIAADEYKRQLQDRQNQFYGLASNIPTQMAVDTGKPELAPSYLSGIPPQKSEFDTQPPQEDVPDVVSNKGLLAANTQPTSDLSTDRPGYSDIPEGFSPAPSWREDIMKQLDEDPATKRLTMQMLDTEGGGKATMEALVNRTAMIRQKIPDWSLKDELTSGFYGPINRGYAQTLNLHPDTIKRYQQDIDAVRAGSNVIAGRTDQGYRGDPNSQGPGRVIPPGSSKDEIYNYWTGKRQGVNFSHADAADFADQVLRGGPKFGSTAEDWAKQEIAKQRAAQYSDIPEGFSVPPAQAQQYSDIPEGFSVGEPPPQEKAPVPPVDLKPSQPAPAPPTEAAPLKDIAPPVSPPETTSAFGRMAGIAKPTVPSPQATEFANSLSRENAKEILGMGQALNQLVISPLLQGASEIAGKVAPDSQAAKLLDKANKDWWDTMVTATEATRKSLAIDPKTTAVVLIEYQNDSGIWFLNFWERP